MAQQGGSSRKQVTRLKLLTEGGVADTGQDNRMRGEPLLSHDHGGVGLISTGHGAIIEFEAHLYYEIYR